MTTGRTENDRYCGDVLTITDTSVCHDDRCDDDIVEISQTTL